MVVVGEEGGGVEKKLVRAGDGRKWQASTLAKRSNRGRSLSFPRSSLGPFAFPCPFSLLALAGACFSS